MKTCADLYSTARARGFTLMEAVVVISITAIIVAIVAVFMRLPVQGYIDSSARADMADVADTALGRMKRELRTALPNSVRVGGTNNSYLEFLLTKYGGRYLDVADAPFAPGTGNILYFGTSSNCVSTPSLCWFDIVGPRTDWIDGRETISANDYIVVYNLGPGMAPADAYDCSAGCNRQTVASTSYVGATGIETVKLAPVANATVFAMQSPAMASPGHRFQVVSGPVTYFCDGLSTGGSGKLFRYANYTIQSNQPVSPASLGAAPTVLASGVDSCVFDSASLPNTHTGLVTLRLNLISPVNQERVTLVEQIHVDNTP